MDKKSFLELGEYLREKRLHKNLTQVDVADRLGYRSQFIANWERGASAPPMQTLKKLVDIYGISQREMLTTLEKIQSDFFKRSLFGKPARNSA